MLPWACCLDVTTSPVNKAASAHPSAADEAYGAFQHQLEVFPAMLDGLPPEMQRIFFEGEGAARRLRPRLMPLLRELEAAVHRCGWLLGGGEGVRLRCLLDLAGAH